LWSPPPPPPLLSLRVSPECCSTCTLESCSSLQLLCTPGPWALATCSFVRDTYSFAPIATMRHCFSLFSYHAEVTETEKLLGNKPTIPLH
jgi:hypothetical protein